MRLSEMILLVASALVACSAQAPVAPATTASAAPLSSASWSPLPDPSRAPPPVSAQPWSGGCIAPELENSVLACPTGEAGATYVEVLDAEQRADKARQARGTKGTQRTLDPRPLLQEEVDLQEITRRFVCAPPAGVPGDLVSNTTYSLARSYFEAQHWAEAAAVFHRLAVQLPATDDLAPYTAQLLLESLNLLASGSAPRPACQSALRAETTQARQRLCTPKPTGDREEVCSVLARIERDLAKRPAP